MHEWALAEATLSAAAEEARRSGLAQVSEVTVRLGELQRVDPDVMLFALENLLPSAPEPLRGTRFMFESEPAAFRCRSCEAEWTPALSPLSEFELEAIHFVPEMAHVYIGCPGCGGPDFEVVRGRGVTLTAMRGTA